LAPIINFEYRFKKFIKEENMLPTLTRSNFGNLFNWEDDFNKVLDIQSGWAVNFPKLDIHEDKDSYYVDVDLAGLDKKDVSLKFKDGVLTISGERKNEKTINREDYYRRERSFGKFERSVSLPSDVNGSAIKADFKNGVLEIKLPKLEEKKEKEITINVA
jgi:HSP20 family protein